MNNRGVPMFSYMNTRNGDVVTFNSPCKRRERMRNWVRVGTPTDPLTVVDAPLSASTIAEGRPRGNASREAWAEYAAAFGHEITDEMSRNDIRDLCG